MTWADDVPKDSKFVGYFPTPQFWTIIDLWKEEQVRKQIQILRLKCLRGAMRSKNVLTPLPYIEVIAQDLKTVCIDYDYVRHGELDIDRLCKGVGEQGVKELVVENLRVKIPRDLFYKEVDEEAEIDGWQTGKYLVATFSRKKAVLDGKFREEIVKHTKDWLELGGKVSSLDLTELREAKYWRRKGNYGTYDVNYNYRIVVCAMKALDPFGSLGRWREYKKKKGTVWSLSGDYSIKEGR